MLYSQGRGRVGVESRDRASHLLSSKSPLGVDPVGYTYVSVVANANSPNYFRHRAPGCELELRLFLVNHSHLRSKQQTTRPIYYETVYYCHALISASGGRDTTAITGDEDIIQEQIGMIETNMHFTA